VRRAITVARYNGLIWPGMMLFLGAATLTALIVTGQLVCSVALDHFGLVGFDQHAASLGRIAGCLLMICGFVLIARF
jgi:transporter family-2 protein